MRFLVRQTPCVRAGRVLHAKVPFCSPRVHLRGGAGRRLWQENRLREGELGVLHANARWLERWTTTRIIVEGHCDARGTAEYNLALGERRAASVKRYLVSLGIAAERGATVSKGEEEPVCQDPREVCWQQNRRGHAVIIAKWTSVQSAPLVNLGMSSSSPSHYDAKAHLVVARRIVDSLQPGWMQTGAVWLPLPHLLNVAPVQIDWLYRTGWSAVALSIAGFVLAAASLWWLIARSTGSRSAPGLASPCSRRNLMSSIFRRHR